MNSVADAVAERREHFGLIRASENYADGKSVFDFLSRLTDLGNAERFAYENAETLRYCQPYGAWMIFDGKRWVRDNSNAIVSLVKKSIRGGYAAISQMTDGSRRAEIAGWLAASESASRVRACTELAKSELPGIPEQFDADPWLLNLENGTLDLRTLALRAHDSDDLITKFAGSRYDPDALCPVWEATLDRVFAGNERLIDYVRRTFGYALTAETSEQCLFVAYGAGANGKTTILRAISDMMGDYAMSTPTDSLLVKREGGIPNDLARLKGARLVTATEADQGRRLAESLVKQLTGGDPITARFLHAEYFQFYPTFKLFLATNHKPVIRGTDHAIWRRIRLIPFEVTIPTAEQDPDLPAKLHEECSGILNWCLLGLEEWKAERLGYPEEIREATDGYRLEMDDVGAFLDEAFEADPGGMISVRTVYEGYEKWRSENGGPEISKRKLAGTLRERGFDDVRRNDGTYFIGIRERSGEREDE